jgi:PAS domain S-box-containing protein
MKNTQLKIFVIDDDEDDLFLVTEFLKGIDTFNITIDTEINYNRAYSKILENQHDIYIIDYLLGPHTGIELIEKCVTAGINKPFILLTGKGDKQIDIDATKAGAYDYLIKTELSTEMLERSLRYSAYRYKSYREVLESEKRFRDIFEKSTDIIFLLDDEFNLINFNPALGQVLYFEEEEIKDKPINTLFDNEEAAQNFKEKIRNEEKISNYEVVLQTKNNEPVTFLASCTKIAGPEGNSYQGIFFDYTTIKKSVADAILRERTAANHQLVRTLAHEIRNPLTNINLSINYLEEEVGEDLKMYTEMVRRNSDRINALLTELVTIANPTKLKLTSLTLSELINETMLAAEDRIKLNNINLVKNLSSDCQIIVDKEKIKIALLNIVINGIEAIDSKTTGNLQISTDVNEHFARIKITDNGVGIAPGYLDKLFQPYFTGKKNGMGLGLAATEAIIKAHNGNITVDSEPGKGTTFGILLPLSENFN